MYWLIVVWELICSYEVEFEGIESLGGWMKKILCSMSFDDYGDDNSCWD